MEVTASRLPGEAGGSHFELIKLPSFLPPDPQFSPLPSGAINTKEKLGQLVCPSCRSLQR